MMRFKPSFKFMIKQVMTPTLIFYGVSFLLYSLVYLLVNVLATESTSSTTGIGSSSIIFLFIVAIASFKSPFNMLMANATSRKSVFNSAVVAFVALCASMAVINALLAWLLPNAFSNQAAYLELFAGRYSFMQPSFLAQLWIFAETSLWYFAVYLAFMSIGYFIGVAYYRMNTLTKVLVSVSVPMFIFVGLPVLNAYVFNERLFNGFLSVIKYLWGIGLANPTPYPSALTAVGTAVVVCGFTWLLVRKATVKN